jgi:uncharacterized repeat protein (TIGR02543 family)
MKRIAPSFCPGTRAAWFLFVLLAALFSGCPEPDEPGNYSYTVTFFQNDGTESILAMETVESPATTVNQLPPDPVRLGYRFAGWNTASNGSGITFTLETPVPRDLAVYAQWGSYAYTVTFNANGGDTPANPAAKTVATPAFTIDALPAPPAKAGHIFAGWNTALDGSGAAFDAASPVSVDMTVYAQWVLDYTYTVTFDANGGDSPANPAAKTVSAPASTIDALPAPPARAGLVFAGWNTALDGSGAAFDAATPVTADMTVYAQWILDYTYTVTFDSNGGDSPASPAAKTVNAPATTIDALPAPPAKANHAFAGWNTAADGSGAAFEASTPVEADITVYAQWRTYTYTVTFDSNGGDSPASPAAKTVTAPATTIDALPAPPTRAGQVFAGWNIAANGSGAAFEASTPVTGDLTVYAQWVTDYAYTVTFNANGGDSPASPATKTVNAPATTIDALPAPPSRTGYTFANWNTDSMGLWGTPFTASTPVSGNLIVYAQWTPHTYRVDFDKNGGDTEASPPYRDVTSPAVTASLPVPPGKAGYAFTGWNTAADGSGDAFDASTPVSAPLRVYAQWVLFTSASQDIRLFMPDPGQNAFIETPFTLVQGGAPASKTISLIGTWDASPQAAWTVDGRSAGSGPTLTLNAAAYTVGGHRLQVTAYKDGKPWSKTLDFSVTAALTNLTLSAATLRLPVGGTAFLAARPVPSNAGNRVSWTSGTPAVATVDAQGLVRAVAPGTAILTAASLENPAISSACTVTVTAPLDIPLALDDPGKDAFSGESFTLVQGGAPASQTISLTGTWDASPSPAWTVDGRSAGSGNSLTLNAADYTVGGHRLQVTAYKGGTPWSKTLAFKVIAGVTGLQLNKTSLALAQGETETLLVRVVPANAADKEVTWTSGDTAVVTVDAQGRVSAVAPGTALVTVRSEKYSTVTAACTVRVGQAQTIGLGGNDPGAGALNGESFSLSKAGGSTKTLTLTGTWDASPAAEWRIDGIPRTSGGTCLIDPAAYNPGGHTLQVTVYQGGRPWSKTIQFTITN